MKTPDSVTREIPARFALLDLVRGFAALWVFAFHYPFSQEFTERFSSVLPFFKVGDRGVPLFFVVSGYCITLAAVKGAERGRSTSDFLVRRARRIYPTFWCSVALVLVLRYVACSTGAFASMPTYSWEDWVRILTLTQSFHDDGTLFWARYAGINGAYWTLSVELQFYLVVGLLCLRTGKYWSATNAVLGVVSVWTYWRWTSVAGTGLFLPFWSWFACGVALFDVQRRGWTPDRLLGTSGRRICLLVPSVLVAAFVFLTLSNTSIPRSVFALGSSVILWCLLPFDEALRELSTSRSRALRTGYAAGCTLGAMSYSTYLMHNEISMLIQHGGRSALGLSGVSNDLLVFACTLLGCYAFYVACEAPFLRMFGGRRKPPAIDDAPRPTANDGESATPVVEHRIAA